MNWKIEHWNKLLLIFSALIGGIVGFFSAMLTLESHLEPLQEELSELRSVRKALESTKQISSAALSKATDAISSSTSAHDLANRAIADVASVEETAKQALETASRAETATKEALSQADKAVSQAISASHAADAAKEIANLALNEAKMSTATATEAKENVQRSVKNWPGGTYCVLKRGSHCPSGFTEGHLHFDTEDDRGDNRWSGLLPAGSYYRNNLDLTFCCK